jgi:hypothetical protein
MHVMIRVKGLPPKKDGANSMWRQCVEIARLKALRGATVDALCGQGPIDGCAVSMALRVFACPDEGDLDNFVTGICDGLMAAHRQTPIDRAAWESEPVACRPDRAIAFHNDADVCRILAERLPPDAESPRYELELSW